MGISTRARRLELTRRIRKVIVSASLVACLVAVATSAHAQCPLGSYSDSSSPGYQAQVIPYHKGLAAWPWFSNPDGSRKALPAGCAPCFAGQLYGVLTSADICPTGSTKSGFACSGNTNFDSQTCTATTHPQGGPGRCPVGSVIRPGNPSMNWPASYGFKTNPLQADCSACDGGFYFDVGDGHYRQGGLCTGLEHTSSGGSEAKQSSVECGPYQPLSDPRNLSYTCAVGERRGGARCDGTGISDTQFCVACAFGGAAYECGMFNRRANANACSGTTFEDTNVCVPCSNSNPSGGTGTTYQCGVGQLKSGDSCPGVTTADTQMCSACTGGIGWNCGSGYRRSGEMCNGTTSHSTQQCLACGNGGSSYACNSGDYKSGLTCGGTDFFDSQTCSSCAATGAFIPPGSRCAAGQRRVGLTCTNASSAQEVCATCGNGGASYDCGAGGFRSGNMCMGGGAIANATTSPDTQTCSTCNGGAPYDCGDGSRRTGSACGGTGPNDSQTCAACGNGGASYDCGAGTQSGTMCSGFSSADTQTCAACSTCQDGQYEVSACTSTQDTQCASCPEGCATCTSATICTSCYEGTYQSGDTCQFCNYDCGPGHFIESFCSGTEDTTCGQCAAGTYAPWGFFESCYECDPGTYSQAGAEYCTPCPDGATSGPGADRCTGGDTTTTTLAPTTTIAPTTTLEPTTTTTLELVTTTTLDDTTTTTLEEATTTTLEEPTTTTLPPTTTTTEPAPTTTMDATTTTTMPTPCASSPRADCRVATGSSLQLKSTGSAKDGLKWTWSAGAGTLPGDFHDPVSGSPAYRLCFYDASGAAQPLAELEIPTEGTCGGKPCWKATGTTGFKFKSKDGAPDGITGATLKASAGAAKLQIKGKGDGLLLPPLPMTLPVLVQLVVSSGADTECWQAPYAAASENVSTSFKASAP